MVLAANERDEATYRRLMLEDRNRSWLPRLSRCLREGGAVVIVGIAHFGGSQGLLELLSAQGYGLERIDLPAQ